MLKFIQKTVSDGSGVSSARVINVLGAITGTVLLLYHGVWLNSLSYEVLGVYLAYCGGVYTAGKYVGLNSGKAMDRKYRREDEYGTMVDERFTQHSNGGNGSRIDNPDL